MSEADPLAIACPHCTAAAGEPCERPDGRELAKPHAARRREADRRHAAMRLQAEGDAKHRIEGVRWRRVYAACRLELEARGAWTKLAAEQLESLVLNMEAAELARGKAKVSPTVEGSMGQPVINPAIAVALRYDAQALATARSLKLTPDTRGTSAPADGVGADAPDEPEEPRDELAELDDLARKRREKTKRRRARG